MHFELNFVTLNDHRTLLKVRRIQNIKYNTTIIILNKNYSKIYTMDLMVL